MGAIRTSTRCRDSAHIGHAFEDGQRPKGFRLLHEASPAPVCDYRNRGLQETYAHVIGMARHSSMSKIEMADRLAKT
jgi:hypothetical protein